MTQGDKLQDLARIRTRAQIARDTGIHLVWIERLYLYDDQLEEKDSAKLDRLHELEFGEEE